MNNDLISKSKLIKEIKDVGISQYLNDDGTMSDTYGSTTVMDYIENQPTVNQWIDVEDKLPEYSENVLICPRWGTIDIGWYCNDGWTSEYITYDDGDIIAWMPLPEPYKKEVE